MRSGIDIGIVLLALAGCSRGPSHPATLVVVPGVGIPGVVKLGMSTDQVRRRVHGETVKYHPVIRYPWQVADYEYEEPHFFQARSFHTRKLGEKPSDVEVQIPALGLNIYTKRDTDPIQSMTFWSDPQPPPTLGSNVWFTGQLSCGLSFADRRRVSRREVVEHFGEPEHHLIDNSRTSEDVRGMIFTVLDLLKRGETVSKKHSNGVEHLHYPTNGIMFILQDDMVVTFTIEERVEPATSRCSKPAARSPPR